MTYDQTKAEAMEMLALSISTAVEGTIGYRAGIARKGYSITFEWELLPRPADEEQPDHEQVARPDAEHEAAG